MAENGLNRWTGIGRIAADAEYRAFGQDNGVANFRIGCSRTYVKDGQKQSKTEWVSCALWGKRAASLSPYLTKGMRICVEGELETKEAEKNGEKRYYTGINVSNVVLLDGGKNSGGGRSQGNMDYDPQGSGSGGPGGGYGTDDIPFIRFDTPV